MLAAVEDGDAKELATMMDDGVGWTLLHEACYDSKRSAVIPLLLAHPDIDVNVKTINGYTPFYSACWGSTSCVREIPG